VVRRFHPAVAIDWQEIASSSLESMSQLTGGRAGMETHPIDIRAR